MYLTSNVSKITFLHIFFSHFILGFWMKTENPVFLSLHRFHYYMMFFSFKRSPKIRIRFLSVVHPNNEYCELYAQPCVRVYVWIKLVDCKPHIRFWNPLFQIIFIFHFISLNNLQHLFFALSGSNAFNILSQMKWVHCVRISGRLPMHRKNWRKIHAGECNIVICVFLLPVSEFHVGLNAIQFYYNSSELYTDEEKREHWITVPQWPMQHNQLKKGFTLCFGMVNSERKKSETTLKTKKEIKGKTHRTSNVQHISVHELIMNCESLKTEQIHQITVCVIFFFFHLRFFSAFVCIWTKINGEKRFLSPGVPMPASCYFVELFHIFSVCFFRQFE